jgi:hypothetical protein
MAIYHVTIEGVSALLQHRFDEEAESDEPVRGQHRAKKTPREKAEQAAYRNKAGNLYHPGSALARLLREAGASHKERGSRRSVKYIVPAAVIVVEDAIELHSAAGEPLRDYEVDSRPVVIPSTKGRIMSHRPRSDKWQMSFTLEVDEQLMDAELVHQLLEEGGRRLGIGDYRPEKGGPFGRFAILTWEKEGEAKPRRRART